MKLGLLAIIILTIAGSLHAQSYQSFPDDSASWEITRCWYFFPAGWNDTYEISMDGSDTLYDGDQFYNLFIQRHERHGSFDSIYPFEYFGGFRESGKQVFMFQKWASVDTTVHLVYDFNPVSIGDTVYTSCLAGSSSYLLGHVVSGIDSVKVGSNYHKRLHLHDPGSIWNTESWIEGVGSSWGLPFASFWSITDNSYDLLCYDRDGVNQYWNAAPSFAYCTPPFPTIDCDTTPTIVSSFPEASKALNVFPNPANTEVTIELREPHSPQSVSVFTSSGVRVLNHPITSHLFTLDTREFATGIYIIAVKASGHRYYSKLSVISR